MAIDLSLFGESLKALDAAIHSKRSFRGIFEMQLLYFESLNLFVRSSEPVSKQNDSLLFNKYLKFMGNFITTEVTNIKLFLLILLSSIWTYQMKIICVSDEHSPPTELSLEQR